jgi:hypothetical protein
MLFLSLRDAETEGLYHSLPSTSIHEGAMKVNMISNSLQALKTLNSYTSSSEEREPYKCQNQYN